MDQLHGGRQQIEAAAMHAFRGQAIFLHRLRDALRAAGIDYEA